MLWAIYSKPLWLPPPPCQFNCFLHTLPPHIHTHTTITMQHSQVNQNSNRKTTTQTPTSHRQNFKLNLPDTQAFLQEAGCASLLAD